MPFGNGKNAIISQKLNKITKLEENHQTEAWKPNICAYQLDILSQEKVIPLKVIAFSLSLIYVENF